MKKIAKQILFSARSFILSSKIKKHKKTIYRKIENGCPLNVLFIVQYPEMWNSEKTVYESLSTDKRFNVTLLTIPKNVFNGLKKGMKENVFQEHNVAHEFLINSGYDSIDGYKDKKWVDIKKLKPDYIFIQRPYQSQYPRVYSFNKLSKLGLLCYIPYDGFDFSANYHVGIGLNNDLLMNCFLYFSSTEVHDEYFNKHKYSKYSKSVLTGSPRFDLIKSTEKNAGIKKDDGKVFLWLPRWFFGKGNNNKSNFLNYYKNLFDLFEKKKIGKLIVRPHPLMFDNMVNNNILSKQEIEEIKSRILSSPYITLDMNSDYLPSFLDSDVLIADYTSLLSEFFVLNKPIIYCDSSDDFNEYGLSAFECFYKSSNFNELSENILNIDKLEKNDLSAKRKEIINNWDKKFNKPTNKIIEALLNWPE